MNDTESHRSVLPQLELLMNRPGDFDSVDLGVRQNSAFLANSQVAP